MAKRVVFRHQLYTLKPNVTRLTQLFFYSRFLALLVYRDERDIRLKQSVSLICLITLASNAYMVGRRGHPYTRLFAFKTQDLATLNLVFEFDLIQTDRHKLVPWQIQSHTNVSDFINPLKQISPKQKPIIIQVLG